MKINCIFATVYLFLLFSFCIAFPYIEPSETQQPNQQQQQNQQMTDRHKNVVLKETVEDEVDKQLHLQRRQLASAEREDQPNEKETKIQFSHDNSVEDVSELQFPLDAVITQIDENSNDFHDQMELHHQKQEDSFAGDKAASMERTKLTFHLSSAADGTLSISDRRTASDNKNKPNDGGNQIKEANNQRRTSNDEHFVGNRMILNKTDKITTEDKSEKFRADKVNEDKEKAKNGTSEEEIGEGKGKEQQKQKEENSRTVPSIIDEASITQSIAPNIDVVEMESAESNVRHFSIENNVEDIKETNELDTGIKAPTEERGEEEELTWWDKIVLGLRCARHDCRGLALTIVSLVNISCGRGKTSESYPWMENNKESSVYICSCCWKKAEFGI